jgi:hypothetical protein
LKHLAATAFVASIFLSALLLFVLELMIGRALLPQYGGSPAVWNTAMVCFQILLLAGYGYAHASGRWLRPRGQVTVHGALLIVSAVALPFAIPLLAGTIESPVRSIAAAIAISVGLQFLLLSANSPLAQRWYSLSGSRDPFWLYAASNAGSLIGLLGYPFLYEPLFGLSFGWRIWAALYVVFLALSAICMGIALIRARSPVFSPAQGAETVEPAPSWSRCIGWLFRAAVASSLLLSVTMKISTDLAAGPLLWVLPLALYLLSFVVAFSTGVRIPRWIVATLTAIGIAWTMVVFMFTLAIPLWVSLFALLAALFSGCLLCHSDLARSRPSARHLTSFYLWIALGGTIGGILNGLLAPAIFNSVAEVPITLVCLAFLIHTPAYREKFPRERMRRLTTYLPLATAIIVLGATAAMILQQRQGEGLSEVQQALSRVMPLALVLLGLLFARHAGQFEAVLIALIVFHFTMGESIDAPVMQTRTFFGVTKVIENPRERMLVHGNTLHGAQRKEPHLAALPIRYYHPNGPMGVHLPERHRGAQIGIIGLGVGSLAALGGPDERITFFEIDGEVERIARRYFTYLRNPLAETEVRIGDGRLLLQAAPDASLDLLIVDAFTSDAIPAHLLTREALDLYLRKVRPDGVIIIHISNQHLDLTRVFRGWAAAERRAVAFFGYMPSPADQAVGATPAVAVAIAPDPRVLDRLVERGPWRRLGPGRSVVWTDDRIPLIPAMRQIGP